ncbi:MAG: DUF4349 domain-containing protein [Tenericutes bacterium HGW-Tenericutes-3]|nr:MAG: DUF4349 domain-containing protein [Tenericutes bacterium HGW-Tenericutes-3]
MKKNKLMMMVVLVLSVFLLASCSAEYEPVDNYEPDQDSTVLLDLTTPTRKIIYQVEATLYVDDIDQSIEDIRDLLEGDEWFDLENKSDRYGDLIVRVKTENLDDFIASLNSNYQVSNFTKSATDISLEYQTTEHKIESYEAERAQLVILYEGASLSDMITINTRIAQIDLELGELQGTLNQFDSLVEYSKVTLSLRQNTVASKLPFGSRIVDGFINGFNGLIGFFDILIIALANLLPFAIVFVPAGYGAYRLHKHIHQKNLAKINKK